MKRKLLSVVLCVTMVASMFTGCGKKATETKDASATTATTTGATDNSKKTGAEKYPKFITVDVFDGTANYQGIQSGWFAKIVKDKFNMELNIIAPNVAGGGDTLYQTRSAGGDLGDLVLYGADGGKLKDMITAGLLYDMTDLAKNEKNIQKYQAGIKSLQTLAGTDKVYALPNLVSDQSATTPSEGLDLTYGPYVRWDAYKAAGYPEIGTLEDLLPVLKKMQDAVPKSDTGKKTYAISLFKDWDGNMMCLAKQPTCFYGYDEMGFALAKADGSDYQSIIDSNSQYVRALKFYYQANQLGILDPESTTQNYDTMYTKYQDGQILFSPWPWLGQAAYNTPENQKAGKGFMVANIKDMKIFSNGCKPAGDRQCIAIGSKAEDPQRLADFIDWLYSPEGVEMSTAQTNSSSGPKGLTWEVKDGKPVLTDFGWKAFYEGGKTAVPDEWGGGTWKDGVSALNYQAIATTDTNPETGYPYNYTLWEDTINKNQTNLTKDWTSKMDGAKTTLEYLQKKNEILVAPGSSYIAPAEDTEITTLRGQCKAVIIDNSWKMVFAKNEAEFNKLLADMQKTVKGLGYDKVLAVDMKNSKDQNDARVKAAAASK